MDSKICLTCLCEPSKVHNLNEIVMENLKIQEILHQLVPQFSKQEEFSLSDSICANCLEKLIISFKFQKQCLESLKKIYKLWPKNSLYKETPDELCASKLKTENAELKLMTDNNYDDYSTVGSIPEAGEDLKMSFEEITVDPLTANKTLEEFEIDNNDIVKDKPISEEPLKNYKLECNKNSNFSNSSKYLPEKLNVEAVEKPSVISNQCKICKKVFKHHQGLSSHMSKTHFKKHLYRCQECDKGFGVEELFIRHCNRHLGIKPFPCTQCNKGFDTKGTLNQHMLCHSKESSYLCTICGKTFYRMDVFKQHMHRHDDTKLFECLKCVRSFKSFSDHIKHMDTHKKENSYEGKEQVEDREKYNVKQEKNDAGETEIEFKIEQKTTSDHINDHDSNDITISTESAQCDLCNQVFKNPQGLARHRSSTHFKKHLYQCDQCDRGFSVEEYYIKHRNRHLGIKTFKCNQCDKAFETNSILNQHLISHSKLTPHLCTTCGKSFRRLDGLRQHMLRHAEERPFKCTLCPKSFKCHSDKLKHILKHDEKRYECNICGSRVATPESLSQHKMTHTGEKPFKCSYCDKSFISLSNMRCHERIHTGEKPYKCQYCWKSFRQSNDRKKHTNRLHKNEQNEGNMEENL